jgi:hypothetical protein
MSDYTPRPGSKAYAALCYFQQNSEQALSTQQLAGLLGFDAKKIPALLHQVEASHLLTKRKQGNGYVWCLGERKIDDLALLEPADAADAAEAIEQDGEADPFSFALWQDGELVINGAMETESGIQLTVQQTAKLVAYITKLPDYLEYLGAQKAT